VGKKDEVPVGEGQQKHLDDVRREWALQPYTDNLPYDRQRVVSECQFFLMHMAASKFELGKRLMILKEQEDFQTFGKIISDEFQMQKSAAYNYIAFTKKCMDLSKIKTFGEKNWSKVLALLNTCSEEDLKEIEDNGINGQILDEYDGMSVREFKRLLTQYKNKAEKIIGKQVDKLEAKAKKLDMENKELRAVINKDGTPDSFKEAFETAEDLFNRAVFIFTELNLTSVNGDPKLRTKYQNRIKRMHGQFGLHCSDIMGKLNG